MRKLVITAAASVALLSGCATPPSASAPTATVTATTTVTATVAPAKSTATPTKASAAPTPAPSPIKTSGNYGADLAAAGIVPDSVASYGQFMKEQLCDAPLTTAPMRNYSKFSESIRQLGSAEAKDVASARLSIAYFCPERKALAEDALKLHGYIK